MCGKSVGMVQSPLPKRRAPPCTFRYGFHGVDQEIQRAPRGSRPRSSSHSRMGTLRSVVVPQDVSFVIRDGLPLAPGKRLHSCASHIIRKVSPRRLTGPLFPDGVSPMENEPVLLGMAIE